MLKPSFFMASWVAGSEGSARFRSLITRLALCDVPPAPGAAAATLAAVMAPLKALKKLPIATVTSEEDAVVGNVVSPFATTWLLATADLSKPNLESLAVVVSTSACSRLSTLANCCDAAVTAVDALEDVVVPPARLTALLATRSLIFMVLGLRSARAELAFYCSLVT